MAGKFVISAGVTSQSRSFFVMRSEELIENNSDHCFLVEMAQEGFEKVASRSTNISASACFEGRLLFASHRELFELTENGSSSCHQLPLPKDLMLLHRIKTCGSRLFLLGDLGKIYARTTLSAGDYQLDMAGIAGEKLFNDIYQDDKLGCVVGFGGSVWVRSGYGKWTPEDVGTNVALTSVTRFNQKLLLGGLGGVLVYGTPGAWQHVEHDFEGSDIWALTVHREHVLVLTDKAVLEWREGNTKPVFISDQGRGVFFAFSENQKAVWAIGEKVIVEFDGQTWREVASLP